MQIDTIKKVNKNSDNTLDLKSKGKKTGKKPFKLTYLKVISKGKKDIIFYISLILIMGLIIFFWVLNFKSYYKEFEKASKEGQDKYQQIKSAYEVIKKDMDYSIKNIKENIESVKNIKKENQQNSQEQVNKPNLQENLLLDSLTDEQKIELSEKISNTNNTEELPIEFSQEELKVRLDSLNK